MRLETPVLYVHLPEGVTEQRFAVTVAYRGGWLTEWFPAAEVDNPGLGDRGGDLRSDRSSRLHWPTVIARRPDDRSLGLPETHLPVWLAPRQVQAADLLVGDEAERYLFYRGVGATPAPLQARIDDDGLTVAWIDSPTAVAAADMPIWLVDVDDGRIASRQLTLGRPADWTFTASAYRSGPADLHAGMQQALQDDGLFADEAAAMLATWEESYFKREGMRIFYLVPRQWTDRELPLHLSVPATVVRTMVGRLELLPPDADAVVADWLAIDPADIKRGSRAYGQLHGMGPYGHAYALDWLDRHPTPGAREQIHRLFNQRDLTVGREP